MEIQNNICVLNNISGLKSGVGGFGNLKVLDARGSVCLSIGVIPFRILHVVSDCSDVTDNILQLTVEFLYHVGPFAMLGRNRHHVIHKVVVENRSFNGFSAKKLQARIGVRHGRMSLLSAPAVGRR